MPKETFSMKVRREAAEAISSRRHCQLAELAGLLMLTESCSNEGITFYSETIELAKKVFTLIRKTFKINADVTVLSKGNGGRKTYKVCVTNNRIVREILGGIKYPIEGEQNDHRINEILIQRGCCKRAFVRGCFLAGGSVTDPSKGYHLEIVCPDETKTRQLCKIITGFADDDFGDVKYTSRKRTDGHSIYVLYIKEGDRISDFLNLCECYRSLMEMENIRVEKEIANSLNRRQNCEMANMVKTISAAQEQKNDIAIIDEMLGIDKLSAELQEIARIRLQDTEMTLKELGEALSEPVGKSCVNHRLRKIKRIAEDLRSGKEIKL